MRGCGLRLARLSDRVEKVVVWAARLSAAGAVVLVAAGSAGCAASDHARTPPAFCRQFAQAQCLVAVRGRFVVAIVPEIARAADSAGVSLDAVVGRDLARVAAALPGPRTDIEIDAGNDVIPAFGDTGVTDPGTGQVTLTVDDRHGSAPLRRTITHWLLQDFSHEIDHSVRFESGVGPGGWEYLYQQVITEGLATAFDLQLQPGLPLPWLHALTAPQERRLWARMRLDLYATDAYSEWFSGGDGVPDDTAFQIGYHIVRAYLTRHPRATAAFLVDTPAQSILGGSGYDP
jgi:hypothetical protein